MKTHGLHESTCYSNPPHTPSLSPQIRSPYPAFQINIKKNEMPYTESPGPEDPVPKGPVCHDTTQTHNSLLADTRTFMLQPYQMPYVKLLRYLHNCISFNCKYYRSFTSNVCLISTYTRKLSDVKSNAFLTMKSSTPQLVPNK